MHVRKKKKQTHLKISKFKYAFLQILTNQENVILINSMYSQIMINQSNEFAKD